MRFKPFGKTGLEVSEISLGTWAYGNDFWGKVDDRNSIDTIHKAIDLGVTMIDTAPAYGDGHAEEVVGKAIKGHRDDLIITTKCGILPRHPDGSVNKCLKPESLFKEIDASLKRLDVDVIDVYLLHWPDVNTPLEATGEAMAKIKESGKIKHFGVSNFSIEEIETLQKFLPVEVYEPHYSMLERDNVGTMKYCEEKGIAVMTYGGLAAGLLTGKFKEIPKFEEGDNRAGFYPFFEEPTWSKVQALLTKLKVIADGHGRPLSQLAINYLAQKSYVSNVIVGAKRPDQMEENARTMEWKLTDAELDLIEKYYEETMLG